MTKHLTAIAIIVLVIAGIILFSVTRTKDDAPETAATPEAVATTETYTLADVNAHSTAEDCWVALNDTVYDITEFIASGTHKPGMDAVIDRCGGDVTNGFPVEHVDMYFTKATKVLTQYSIGTFAQ